MGEAHHHKEWKPSNKGRNDPERGQKIAAVDAQQKAGAQKEFYKDAKVFPPSRQVIRRALLVETKQARARVKLHALRDKARGKPPGT